jgi:hypothetical protein
MSASERRSALQRRRVYYRVNGHLYAADLVFEDYRPVLVLSWRTVEGRRLPYIAFLLDATQLRRHPNKSGEYLYEGDLLRTGKTTSAPPPWSEPKAA